MTTPRRVDLNGCCGTLWHPSTYTGGKYAQLPSSTTPPTSTHQGGQAQEATQPNRHQHTHVHGAAPRHQGQGRTDNGPEYVNQGQRHFLTSKGIEAQTTMAYTPGAKRQGREAQSDLHQQGASHAHRIRSTQRGVGEAIMTASDLRNISPTANHNKTPYEASLGASPTCPTSAPLAPPPSSTCPRRSATATRATGREGRFVGYPEHGKVLPHPHARRGRYHHVTRCRL